MFKIHPVEEHSIAKMIKGDLLESELLFVVNEEGKFTGYGVSEIKEGAFYIKNIDAPYEDARFLMFMGMLNYAERRGIKTAYCKDEKLDDLCKRTGFDENKSVSLDGFFKSGAHCNH